MHGLGARSIKRTDRSQLVCGTLLDGFAGQIHKYGGFVVTNPVNLAGRYLHFLAGKPVAGFDDQLTNGPALGVHHKITDVADYPVAGLDVVAVHGLRAPQMGIRAFVGTATCSGRLTRKRFGATSAIGKPLMPHNPLPSQ